MALVPTHPTILFPRLKIKPKDRHFDATEVIEAELQTMLNTTSKMAQKWHKRWER
jgi:DNA-directed RNA polymerase subunit L